MKTKTLKLLLTLACIVLINTVKSQVFQNTSNSPNFGSTVPQIRSVGIGAFPNTTDQNARLHVSNFYCNQPNGALNGYLFRTDGRTNVLNQWQMFTGNNPNNLSEKGKIFNYSNNPTAADRNNFSIQATAGHLTFHTGTTNADGVAIERMRIVGGTGPTAGFVGIGTRNPQSELHVHDGATTYAQFTTQQTTETFNA